MRYFSLLVFCCFTCILFAQSAEDDFEGNGTITSWVGDNCNVDSSFSNPFKQDINTSQTVLKYEDIGGQYANVRFDFNNFDLTVNNTFVIKIYVPSSSLTGNQNHQVSLKLQNNTLGQPWTTQSEIIKPIELNQWQEVSFDFENDSYINLDPNSGPPLQRSDFNRVLIQVNGENNNDLVTAYIDDFINNNTVTNDPVFDTLVWADEFDGSGGIDTNKWFHQTQLPAGGSWYNGEIQHYTDRLDNSFVNGGFLNLVAKKETFTDQAVTKEYTSARLNSKFAFTYGKVEIRAKLPTGIGTWPAMWMLGQNINEDGAYWDNEGFDTTSWPACGEIDIMEHWGDNQNFVQSAMHTPSSFGNTSNKGGQIIPTASTEFHVYTLEWTSEKMVFKVDGILHYTYNPIIKNADTWPFDAPQYLLLNTAILPNIAANFTESAMQIDYIRVYQESALSTNGFEDKGIIGHYPNPVKDTINISLHAGANKNVSIQIVDINGRVVSKEQRLISQETFAYDVSSLHNGFYIMRLIFKDGTSSSFKFIKH